MVNTIGQTPWKITRRRCSNAARGSDMTSPNTLARFGIAPDLYRPGWHCNTCRVQLQNGLTGARAHYDQVHVLAELDPPALYVLPR